MRAKLPDAVSIDSGVILSYLLGERTGSLVKRSIFTERSLANTVAFCSGTTLAEVFYILCRRRGPAFAQDAVDAVVGSGYLVRVSSPPLDIEAGRYKCERSISLADCYVLAVAKLLNAAALFAKREDEIDKEGQKSPFGVEVLFLEDFV